MTHTAGRLCVYEGLLVLAAQPMPLTGVPISAASSSKTELEGSGLLCSGLVISTCRETAKDQLPATSLQFYGDVKPDMATRKIISANLRQCRVNWIKVRRADAKPPMQHLLCMPCHVMHTKPFKHAGGKAWCCSTPQG
jgi:hypothetical protein